MALFSGTRLGPYEIQTREARTFDVAPDGRVLMIDEVSGSASQSIVVAHNWFEELEHLVPRN